MAALIRALVYATAFVGVVLVFLPAQILDWSGLARPTATGLMQIGGAVVTAAGAALVLWCVLTFALVGRGTPAPFDPPRKLVTEGPYRWVRNPMYLGAGTVLAGVAMFYGSVALVGLLIVFMAVTAAFILSYEEPTLRRMFGEEYEAYCARVSRWVPRRPVD